MTWECFRLTFELLSPLHVGFHKVGSVQRTRHYIPARNVLASMAEVLVRRGVLRMPYQDALAWVRQHLCFSYFFISEGQELLHPCYGAAGLAYGGLARQRFDRRYLSAVVATAIDATTSSAQEGSLHEVEFISPHRLEQSSDPRRTEMSGWAFVREDAWKLLKGKAGLEDRLAELSVGGERRYGFGRLRLRPADWKSSDSICGSPLTLDTSRPQVTVAEGGCFLAHALADDVQARGAIEPLVGRETRNDSGTYGRTLTRSGVCWVPGSSCQRPATFDFSEEGIWKRAH